MRSKPSNNFDAGRCFAIRSELPGPAGHGLSRLGQYLCQRLRARPQRHHSATFFVAVLGLCDCRALTCRLEVGSG